MITNSESKRFQTKDSSRQKVFCIGYNKTGTTTMEQVLKDLGYSMPLQQMQETDVVEEVFQGNYEPIRELCENYDAFQDLPFSQGNTYAELDAMFSNAKFILTVREPDAWFESLKRFHLNGILKNIGITDVADIDENTFKDKAVYLHENYVYNIFKRDVEIVVDGEVRHDWSKLYDRDHRINIVESRNRDIINHFQDRAHQLLVIDITKERDTSKIVEFLDLSFDQVAEIPHLNKSN